MSTAPSTSTRTFARVMGPYLIITPLTALFHHDQMRDLLADFTANPLLPWVVGAFVLVLGLVVVALHTSWSNPPAVIVSVIGWLMVIRGAVLMAFPTAFMAAADAMMGTGVMWRVLYVALAVVGVYLSVVGWSPVTRTSEVRSPS